MYLSHLYFRYELKDIPFETSSKINIVSDAKLKLSSSNVRSNKDRSVNCALRYLNIIYVTHFCSTKYINEIFQYGFNLQFECSDEISHLLAQTNHFLEMVTDCNVFVRLDITFNTFHLN